MKYSYSTRFFLAISVTLLIWAILMGWQKPKLLPPPLNETKIINITILTSPKLSHGNSLIEVKAKDSIGNSAWWYFPNVDSLLNGLKRNETFSVWISANNDVANGGNGFIWQVTNQLNHKILEPEQVVLYRHHENGLAAFKMLGLLILSGITGLSGYINYRKSKI
jgi:hypothetical protein